MRIQLALVALLGMAALSCGEDNIAVNVDLLPLIDVADVNFHSPTYSADSNLPLNQDLPAGTSLSYSHLMMPTRLNLQQAGSDLSEIESALLTFRMNIESQGFSGTCALTLYIGTMVDVYHDPAAVILTDKKILPATFELSSSENRLTFFLEQEEFYVAYQVLLEPLRLSSYQNSASGQIETFTAEIKGRRGLL